MGNHRSRTRMVPGCAIHHDFHVRVPAAIDASFEKIFVADVVVVVVDVKGICVVEANCSAMFSFSLHGQLKCRR